MNLFYRFIRVFSKVALKVAFKMEYEGLENIPEGGGYLVCANHRTMLDPFFFAFQFKPQLFFMAKAELFRNKLFAMFFRALGSFPVERGTGDSGALDYAMDILRDGKVLAMFPEGTRSKTGVPLRPKSGAALVAIKTRSDVLPIGISFDNPIRFRRKITIRIGKLIRFEELGAEKGLPSEMKQASKLIMGRIVDLVDVPVLPAPAEKKEENNA